MSDMIANLTFIVVHVTCDLEVIELILCFVWEVNVGGDPRLASP